MSETLLLVAGGIGILLAGVGIGYWFASSRVQLRIAEAEEIRDKFDAYRRDVTRHFGRTAEHFQAIGEQYRELYEHLASGADSFCDTDTLNEKLAHEPAPAIGKSAQHTDEPPAERPRDYAEGEHADDDADIEIAAAEAAGETPVEEDAAEPAATDEEAPRKKAAAEQAAADEDAQQPAAADGNGSETELEKPQAGEAEHESVTATADDLKPEVKSDAEEKPSQPTLH